LDSVGPARHRQDVIRRHDGAKKLVANPHLPLLSQPNPHLPLPSQPNRPVPDSKTRGKLGARRRSNRHTTSPKKLHQSAPSEHRPAVRSRSAALPNPCSTTLSPQREKVATAITARALLDVTSGGNGEGGKDGEGEWQCGFGRLPSHLTLGDMGPITTNFLSPQNVHRSFNNHQGWYKRVRATPSTGLGNV
jgi:hypothetical protein